MAPTDRVLVACPTYSGMDPVLDEYLDRYTAFRFPNRKLLLVDNTKDGGAYADGIASKVTAVGGEVRHVEPSTDWEDTFYRSWRVIANTAEWNGYQWVASIEADVMCPPLTLDTLLNVAAYTQSPFVTHHYPYHSGRPGYYEGLGLVLMTTGLLCGALDVEYQRVPLVEAAIYNVAKRGSHVTLHDLLPVEHRDIAVKDWQYAPIRDESSVGIEA